ncbi:MAG: shikimate kinase [Acetobacteraceae bacterium]
MGAGKSAVGRRLAVRLGLPFRDSDAEIEAASGRTVPICSRSSARRISATASAK